MLNQIILEGSMEERWLSVDEIAQHLGVRRDTVYKWISRKRLPGHKVGRLWKFRKSEVDDWVCSEKSDSTGAPGAKRKGPS
jgi:excisionase family DNA binding protein